jgi:alpha-N-arabinofuranosidase
MKKILLYVLLVLIYAQSWATENKIIVKDSVEVRQIITPQLFGSFFEFYPGFINGEFGLWAQELNNRGFDFPDYIGRGASFFWDAFNPDSNRNANLQLRRGGYNPNGRFYQQIIKNDDEGVFGIYQTIYFYDKCPGDFYVYLRTKTNTKQAYVLLCDTLTNEILWMARLDGIDNEWRKFSVKTASHLGTNKVKLVICLKEAGSIDIDEASFMSSNNVDGIRAEYFKLYKEWQPGIIRYPGGWFADSPVCFLDYMIGDIDKRESPNVINFLYSQRFDFGLDEFIKFCENVNAEPHLVVNLGLGTPEQSAQWVEYCNTPSITEYGAKRAANGHPEPYNVKYWEIGNEQWEDILTAAKEYVKHYDEMKAVDSDIETMFNFNYWAGESSVDTILSVIGDKIDYYSYHLLYPVQPESDTFDVLDRYLIVMGIPYWMNQEIINIKKWKSKWDENDKIKLALTELLLDYGIPWTELDSGVANSTLETGLWMAAYLNYALQNSNDLKILEKTFAIGHIKAGYNKEGKRIFYPTPIHNVISFYKNHSGDTLLYTEVECDRYISPDLKGLAVLYDIPYLSATATKRDSTIYLSVVNIHLYDTLEAEMDFYFLLRHYNVRVYELNAESVMTYNSADNPDRVNYVEKKVKLGNTYRFPAHSHTIIELTPKQESKARESEIQRQNNNFIIFPNPAEKFVFIEIIKPSVTPMKAVIYNSIGEIVKTLSVASMTNFLKIETSSWAKGTYYVKIEKNGALVFSSKFIIL